MSIFYTRDLLRQAGKLEIEDEEARHMIGATRLRKGDKLTLTDGCGTKSEATIIKIDHRPCKVTVEIGQCLQIGKPHPELVLASALPKGERQAVMLDLATQLGMSRFIPLQCEFSISKPSESSLRRWHRCIISACKQSHRVHFPVIGNSMSLNELVSQLPANVLCLVGDWDGLALMSVLKSIQFVPETIIILVGPQGGFSMSESALMARFGVHKVCLGPYILRTEAAGAALLAGLNQMPVKITGFNLYESK